VTFPVVYTREPTKPSGGPRPGTRILLGFIIDTFDAAVHGDEISNLGIYNPRDVRGNPWPKWKATGSQHARGAAGDAGVPVQRPHGHPEGHRLANWLVAHHAALGVQEVIWAGRRWDNQTQRWARYDGRSDHFDHVHFAQTAQAADELTLAQVLAVWNSHPAPSLEDDMAHGELLPGMNDKLDDLLEAVSWLKGVAGDNRWNFAAIAKVAAAVQAEPIDIDEDALAEAVAELLNEAIPRLSDPDVDRLARAAADEADRRDRERLQD
jgi:hypothetical protein